MKILSNYFLLSSLCLGFGKCSMDFSNVSKLVDTSKCTIPDIPPFASEQVTSRKDTPISCTDFDQLLTYTIIRNGTPWLYLKNTAVSKYFGSPERIDCCYSYVYRNGSGEWPDVGVVGNNCRPFRNEVELEHDTVWISCKRADEPLTVHGYPRIAIYETVHQVVRIEDNVRQKTKTLNQSTTKKPISVLILGIDSVSRLNFIRTMPKTRDFIMENQFHELKGYNTVDDNTFPNAMAFLTGLNLNDALKICRPTEEDGLNECPFIWDQYRQLGYVTAYGEDWSQLSTFNYLKKGFKNRPTDYYFKPYMDALTYLRTRFQDSMPFCAGPESQGSRILNLAYDYATTFKDLPSFGLFWMNTFSRDNIDTPQTMDQTVRTFFKKLKISGVLEESIVILLSNHGIRYGGINNTPRSFYEVRLPMNYVSLPAWFKQTYPAETWNFQKNTEKLTSTYDLFMTLQHILELSGTDYMAKPSAACQHCKSFFQYIEVQRSCSDAGIPEKWCTCNVNTTTINQNINNRYPY